MGMRINPNFYPDLLQGLSQLSQEQDSDLEQLSSGSKLNSISDNPAAVADLILDRSQLTSANQYSQNISTVQGSLQVADSALSGVVESLTQAISLGTEGANGTMSAQDQQALAVQVTGIQQQLVNLANTSYQGNYIFAGNAVNNVPYTLDESTNTVTYNGDAGISSVEIGEGQSVPVNLPGSQIFNQAGADVFQSIGDLANALQNGGDVAGATTEVQNAFNAVTTQRVFYGSSMSRLTSAGQFLQSEEQQLNSSESTIASANMAQVATNLDQVEVAQQAALEAGAKVSQLSLLNYLQ